MTRGHRGTVLILPFLEQTAMYDSASFDSRFTSSSNVPGQNGNDTLFHQPNPSYWCPSDMNTATDSNRTNYYGVQGGGATPSCANQGNQRVFYTDGVLIHNKQIGFHEITDGTSQVFMLGESKYCLTPTGRPDGIHTGWASGGKVDAYGSPYVCAAAKEQINSISGSGGGKFFSIKCERAITALPRFPQRLPITTLPVATPFGWPAQSTCDCSSLSRRLIPSAGRTVVNSASGCSWPGGW